MDLHLSRILVTSPVCSKARVYDLACTFGYDLRASTMAIEPLSHIIFQSVTHNKITPKLKKTHNVSSYQFNTCCTEFPQLYFQFRVKCTKYFKYNSYLVADI